MQAENFDVNEAIGSLKIAFMLSDGHQMFYRLNAPGVDLSGIKFPDYSRFSGANLQGASFSNVHACQPDFSATLPVSENDKPTNLINAIFTNAVMPYANFAGADMRGVIAFDADFSRSDFKKSNLRFAKLAGAKLDKADFRGADLTGADLRDIDFSSCLINHETRFIPQTWTGLRQKEISSADQQAFLNRWAGIPYINDLIKRIEPAQAEIIRAIIPENGLPPSNRSKSQVIEKIQPVDSDVGPLSEQQKIIDAARTGQQLSDVLDHLQAHDVKTIVVNMTDRLNLHEPIEINETNYGAVLDELTADIPDPEMNNCSLDDMIQNLLQTSGMPQEIPQSPLSHSESAASLDVARNLPLSGGAFVTMTSERMVSDNLTAPVDRVDAAAMMVANAREMGWNSLVIKGNDPALRDQIWAESILQGVNVDYAASDYKPRENAFTMLSMKAKRLGVKNIYNADGTMNCAGMFGASPYERRSLAPQQKPEQKQHFAM